MPIYPEAACLGLSGSEAEQCTNQAVLSFMLEHIKLRSPSANNCPVSSVIVFTFVVNKSGNLSDHAIVKGGLASWNEEVLRVAKLLPNHWQPAKQGKEPICIRYNIPLRICF